MSQQPMTQLQILQENLADLRKIAGWTMEVMAGKLGVSKQTVSNLEAQKVKLSRVQYIAIRAILECEMSAKPSNTTLPRVLGLILDTGGAWYAAHREQLRTTVTAIASIAAAGVGDLSLHAGATALLAPLGAVCSVPRRHGGEPSLQWLTGLLNETGDAQNETEELENENGQAGV